MAKPQKSLKALGPFHMIWDAAHTEAAVRAAGIGIMYSIYNDSGSRIRPGDRWELALPPPVVAGVSLETVLYDLKLLCKELAWYRRAA